MATTTETIVTIFEADVTRLEQGTAKATAAVGGVTKATNDLTLAENKAGQAAGQLGNKFETLKKASANVKGVTQEVNKLDDAQKKAGASSGGMFSGLRNGAAAAGDKIKGIWSGIQGGAGRAAGAVKGLGQGIGSMATSAMGSVSSLAGSFGAMGGPIGLVAGAVVGLALNFKRLDNVATAVDGVTTSFGFLFDRLAGGDLTLLASLANPLTFLANFDKLKEDFNLGQELASGFDALADAEGAAKVEAAKYGAEVQKILPQLRDRTLTVEKRLELADKVTKIEKQGLEAEKAAAAERIRLLTLQERAEAKRLNQPAGKDETKRALEDAQAALFNLEGQSAALLERVNARRNAVLEEAAIENEKRAREALALAQKTAAARVAIEKLAEDQLNRTIERGLNERDLARKKVDDQFDSLKKRTQDAFAALDSLDPKGAAGRAQQQAQALNAIEADRLAELEKLNNEFREKDEKAEREAFDKIGRALQSAEEAKVQAVRDKYDALRDLAAESIRDEQARADEVVRINAAEVDALAELDKERNDKERKEQEKALEERVERMAANIDVVKGAATAAGELVAQTGQEGQLVAEDASKALIALSLDAIQQLILNNVRMLQIDSSTAVARAQVNALATPQSAATGGVAGIVQGALLAALIQGLFAAAKGQIQSLHEGTPYLSRGQYPKGRDTIPTLLDEGERVIPRRDNLKNWGVLEAIRTGSLGEYIDQQFVVPALAGFLTSRPGQYAAQSVSLAKYHDRNIVNELKGGRRQGQRTNDLLATIARRLSGPHRRYY